MKVQQYIDCAVILIDALENGRKTLAASRIHWGEVVCVDEPAFALPTSIRTKAQFIEKLKFYIHWLNDYGRVKTIDGAHDEALAIEAAAKAVVKSGFDMANDGRGFICGVPARMTVSSTNGRRAGLWRNQRIVTESRPAGSDYPKGCTIYAEIRFDDCCGNGHNSFAITATVMNPRRYDDCEACGCLHDDVARVFPELAHLIKWHLCSTDGPMHYVANTIYHASDCDTSGKRKGEVTRTETRLKFNGFPMTFAPKKVLHDWLASKTYGVITAFDVETLITPVEHAREASGYQFDPKYTFAGCTACKWHEAPFDSIREAEEFRDALKLGWEWIVIPTAYSKGKERDFNAARNSGVWPDATDAQLSVSREELKAALMERLPALQAAMKADITGAGLLWTSETN